MSEEKKISRRRYIRYAGGAVAAAVVAAAGYGVYQATQPPAPPPTTTTAPPVTVTTTAAPKTTAPGAPVKITLWTQETPPNRMARQNSILRMFESANPGITVELVGVGWDEIYPKLLSGIAAGNPPDIDFSIPGVTLAAYNAGGTVGDEGELDDLVKRLDAQFSLGEAEKKMSFWKGHYHAIPVFTLIMGVMVRKDVADKAGYPDGIVKTWEDYIAFCQYVKAHPKDPLTGGPQYGTFIPTQKGLIGTEILYNFVINAGGRSVADDGMTPVFNSPETVKALNYIKELAKYRPPGAEDWGWSEMTLPWENGMLASCPNWSTFLTSTVRDYPEIAKQQVYIENPVPASGGVRGSVMYPYAAFISKAAKKQGKLDACLKLLEYLLQPEVNGYLCAMEPLFFQSPHKAGYQSEAYRSDPINQQYWNVVETLQTAKLYGKLYGFEGGEPCLWIGEVEGTDLIAQVGLKVALGQMTAEEGAAWGQAEMEKIAAKYK